MSEAVKSTSISGPTIVGAASPGVPESRLSSQPTNVGHSTQRKPLLNALRRYVSLNEAAITQGTPLNFRAVAACSRDDPVPKFRPDTMMSPAL